MPTKSFPNITCIKGNLYTIERLETDLEITAKFGKTIDDLKYAKLEKDRINVNFQHSGSLNRALKGDLK